MSGLVIIVVLFGLLWFVLIRPQRARAQAQQRTLQSVEPGDEVLTVGGIYGIVQELEPEEDGGDLVVEIAEGIHVRVARKGLARTSRTPHRRVDRVATHEDLKRT